MYVCTCVCVRTCMCAGMCVCDIKRISSGAVLRLVYSKAAFRICDFISDRPIAHVSPLPFLLLWGEGIGSGMAPPYLLTLSQHRDPMPSECFLDWGSSDSFCPWEGHSWSRTSVGLLGIWKPFG